VVRAVAGCPAPVVSAVGHEQDTPLCDLAADVRASTPSVAARLVVPDLDELLQGLERSRRALARGAGRALERQRERLASTRERLRRAPPLTLERRRTALEHAAGRLRALSPQATLGRGYAIVRREGLLVREAAALSRGDRVDVQLAAGSFAASVEETQ